MPPLQRQDTRPSIYSWWSDSNPLLRSGPTVNLHAATKPLMRLMYHRQALTLIESNRAIRLSPSVLEDLSSYLLCKYVSRRTQTMVLEHLCNRAFWNFDDARDIQHSPVLGQVPELLVDEDFRMPSISLVQSLLAHSCGIPVSSTPNNILESFMRNPDSIVGDLSLQVTSALSSQAEHPQEQGPGPHPLVTLLSSSSRHMRWWACTTIIYFFQDGTDMDIKQWKFPAVELVKLLRDEDKDVVDLATYALALGVEKRPEIAPSIVKTAMLDSSVKTLCEGLARLEGRQSLSLSILLDEIPMKEWLTDLRNMDKEVIAQTVLKLVRLSQEPKGQGAILESGLLKKAPELPSFESFDIRSRTCELVENLAQYHTCAPEILTTLCELLKDRSEDIVMRVVKTLNRIPEHLQQEGIATLEAKNFLGSLPPVLRSPRVEFGYPICKLIWNLMKHDCGERGRRGKVESEHEPIINAILGALAEGVRDPITATDDNILRPLAQTIARLSWSPAGAEALVASRGLPRYLSVLLASSNAEIRQSSCAIIQNLAIYEFAAPVILHVQLCGQVLSLVKRRETDATTRALAIRTLGQISRCYKGVTVLVELRALQVLRGLKDSWIHDQTAVIQRNILRRTDVSGGVCTSH